MAFNRYTPSNYSHGVMGGVGGCGMSILAGSCQHSDELWKEEGGEGGKTLLCYSYSSLTPCIWPVLAATVVSTHGLLGCSLHQDRHQCPEEDCSPAVKISAFDEEFVKPIRGW